MKIDAVECFPLKIAPKQIYLGGDGGETGVPDYYYRDEYRCVYSRKMETCLVKVTTDTGLHGWGEALAPVVPQVPAILIEELLAPLLIGASPFDSNVLWSRMYDAMRDRGHVTGFMLDALAACDIALWDLKGKAAGLPVAALLGGAYRSRQPAYVSGLPLPTLDERLDLASDWKAKGFHAIKAALGYGVDEDVDNIRRLRERLGPEVALFLDAHWNYSVAEASELAKRLEPLGLGFLEAPLLPEDVRGHAALRAKTTIPIALGETERTRFQFAAFLDADGVDIVQPDVGRVGITETMRIGFQAETRNLAIAPHLSVGLGPCIAASIHVAAALPNTFMLEYQPPVFDIANTLLRDPLVCRQGHYEIPRAPGLGIEIDENQIRELGRKS
ncbi:mandelate racemase/muconate lactonizing enzyme family protein [Consotaella salsifontis]|uniref:Galactonate dehydratase n=1 Tax=Consotaella salsifontis TaxID=1365950 RepID=A0A1T4S2C7_9HYPH|nr:mandelate racemase/muconate lactonizing enzyme family protein [Consotaella salsifontis]SKA22449.1 galactonate dehydratase [Consotaella salsifontis]